ncbi:tripeptidyl-peptidase 2 [Brachionus plicatilis]|uniref:Tripeptidyl-peptidase 2 n=1 Tax=Brachionus plicatilis TaxID=10195 RepID=A0A3M7QUV9_BRAPC|nr:tripeptidyl-peptidase 2 [Brachionus plicatilis]
MTKINLSKEAAFKIRVYAFFKENRSLGKILTVRHFMAEKIPRSTVYRILKRSEYERKQGSGQTPKKMTKSASSSQYKFDISQQMVSKLLKKLQITPNKNLKIPDRTETQKKVARVKCGNLFLKNPNISWILDDESYFTLSHDIINGNDIFTEVILLQHQQVQNIPQLRNLSINYLFVWSFQRKVFRHQSYEKLDL